MKSTLKRTWADIDLDALEHNYKALRLHVGEEVKFLGVVKADAYGHGAVRVASLLEELGADYLAVSSLDEAMELRENGIKMPVLILGHTPVEQTPRLIELNITQAVGGLDKAKAFSAAAVKAGGTLKVHIKLDTGMSRLGFQCAGEHFSEGVSGAVECCRLPNLDVEGIFTHFAVSDESDPDSESYTVRQFELFCRTVGAIEAGLGQRLRLRHCANTGGVAMHPETYMDMVRPGLLLYGCGPLAEALGLKPVMSLKSTVYAIRTLDAGTDISYGREFTTGRLSRIGVIPCGYADGFPRRLSNRGSVMTADGPAPLRGRICMDMCMVDLTELPDVVEGDAVEIFGEHISAQELAESAGTIPQEITCAVSKRVPRVYRRGGAELDRELLLRF